MFHLVKIWRGKSKLSFWKAVHRYCSSWLVHLSAKYGPLTEPIRILVFILDQFSIWNSSFSWIRTYGCLLSHIVWVVTYSEETTFVRGSTWKLIPPINQKKVCERKSYNRPTSPEFVEWVFPRAITIVNISFNFKTLCKYHVYITTDKRGSHDLIIMIKKTK